MSRERRRADRSSPSLPDFAGIVESIRGYGIFLITPDNTIASWNRGVEEIFGYARDEFVGKSGDILFVPEDLAKEAPKLEMQLARSQGATGDNRWHLRKDGSRLWANGVTVALGRDAGWDGFVKVVRDNTEQKRAQEALRVAYDELERRVEERTAELRDTVEELRKSENLFAAVFRAGPFAAAVVDEGERIREINSTFSRLTGYSPEHVEGESIALLAAGEWPSGIWTAAGGGSGFRDKELLITTKSGDVRVVLASGVELPMDGRRGRLVMFYDVTERKRTEEELMQAIQDVMQDASWFSRSVVERLAEIRSGAIDASRVAELTRRERQVLEQVAKGLSNAEIAENLGIAAQTVRNYITSVYEKIGVKSRVEAVVWARERGLGL